MLTPSTTPTPDSSPIVPPLTPPAGPATVDRRRRRVGRTMVMSGALIATLLVGVGIGRGDSLLTAGDGSTGGSTARSEELALIEEAWDALHERYVDRAQLDDRELAYGAIDGMTEAVGDTGHTSFLTPEERAQRADDLSGSYVGIGVRIDPSEDGRPQVVGVFDDSPAAKAGIVVGDVIEAVDGKATAGVDIDTAIGWVRGEAGTSVTLTVRLGTAAPRDYTITRADVPVTAVTWALVPGTRTALLRLESFSSGAAKDLTAALEAIKAAGADRLILDLRDNPGGYVNEAVDIASQFIKTGNVYIDRDADGKETPHPVTGKGVAYDLPLVVLVDDGTASSAEILSGALQDAKRATVIGVTTFGTGTVLGEFPLKDGSALRIGTVEWLTPDGRRIWRAGITPDVTVERAAETPAATPADVRDLTPAGVDALTDPQLARALSVVAAS